MNLRICLAFNIPDSLQNMNPERWIQVKDVIEAVLERPPSERAAYLDKSCGADGELLSEVESLLVFEESVEKDIFENNHLPCVFSEETKAQSSGFIGKQIGKYRIERELGAGGMGVVFLAERAGGDFEQKVAIKFLRHFSSASAFQRFLLERQILARLHHRFIAQLFDGGTTSEGTPYLVMEYVEGKAITRFADERNLSLEERLELFCKVCSAVSFAHQNLIVHRDLKPDNILITEEGIPKLLDFGIAKLLSETEVKATVTEQQAFTPEYASPEQIKGETITTASDVYVLGIILYELLSGNRPFQYPTNNHKEIWHVVNRTEPTKPSDAAKRELRESSGNARQTKIEFTEQNPKPKIQNPKSLKGDLDNIVLKALKREPERRYKSVEQMTEDLRRYSQGLPIKARPDTFFYRTGKFINRRRWTIIAACLIVSSLLIGMATTIQQSSRAERERLRAEQRAENLRKISKSVVFDVHDAIRNLSGSLPARKILLERAVEQLQLLALDAGDASDLQDELAQAYFSVGEMQQAVGNVAESEESHSRAVAIYQKLIVESPQNPNYLRGLARGYGFLANIAYLRGETGRSVELYAQVPPIFERLNVENKNDVKNLADLWNAYSNHAISLIKTGQANDALNVCQKALLVAEQLNKIDNFAPDNRQILYQTKGLIAAISGMSGDYRNSIAGFKEVISEAEKLHLEFPEDTRFQYDLWAFYRRIGIAFDKSGNFPEAITNLEKSLMLIEELMKSNLKDAGYKRNTSITLLALGQAFSNQKDLKKAINVLLRAREISESLFKHDDRNGETITDLALIYGNISAALAKTGKFDDSLLNLEKSFDFFNRCLIKSSENKELKQSFAEIVKQTAETFDAAAKRQNSEKAKRNLERANSLMEQSRNLINNRM
jgi:serine/threonine protein kinase